jgi:hypothetical protein
MLLVDTAFVLPILGTIYHVLLLVNPRFSLRHLGAIWSVFLPDMQRKHSEQLQQR